MKIAKRKVKVAFTPIEITLETEKEADHFWHLVNAASGQALIAYGCSNMRNGSITEIVQMQRALYNALDPIHTPPYLGDC